MFITMYLCSPSGVIKNEFCILICVLLTSAFGWCVIFGLTIGFVNCKYLLYEIWPESIVQLYCNLVVNQNGPLMHAWTFINILDYSVKCETLLWKHMLSVTVIFTIFLHIGKFRLLFRGHNHKLVTRLLLLPFLWNLCHC